MFNELLQANKIKIKTTGVGVTVCEAITLLRKKD